MQSISFDICTLTELHNRFKDSIINLYKPHRIVFHGLTIITEGTGTHQVDFATQKLSPGTILPSRKGQVHSFEKASQVKGYVISFDENYITNGMNEGNIFHFLQLYHTPQIHVGKENINAIIPYIDKLITLQSNPNDNLKSELIQSLFISLLLEIKRMTIYQHKTYQSSRYKDFLKFQHLIATHFTEIHSVHEYARLMNVSYKYINDLCKDLSKKTAKNFFNEWLLLEIKRKLTEDKFTSQEIAYDTGFSDASNFVRFFKKHEGTTPTKFLKTIL